MLSGRTTSGKLTVAYKLLANAQRDFYGHTAHTVALLDLSRTADPDYMARCGIDLDALLVGRPQAGPEAVYLLGDLLQTGSCVPSSSTAWRIWQRTVKVWRRCMPRWANCNSGCGRQVRR